MNGNALIEQKISAQPLEADIYTTKTHPRRGRHRRQPATPFQSVLGESRQGRGRNREPRSCARSKARRPQRRINTIAMGLSVLLGAGGIAAQVADATQIVKDGGHPLVVALLEEQVRTVTLVVTTVAIGARVLH